jgi:hypothetical protein
MSYELRRLKGKEVDIKYWNFYKGWHAMHAQGTLLSYTKGEALTIKNENGKETVINWKFVYSVGEK